MRWVLLTHQYSLFKDPDSINVKVINDLGPHH